MFWKQIPGNTLVLVGERAKGKKKSKDRVTLVLFCNADETEKRKPIVIGMCVFCFVLF